MEMFHLRIRSDLKRQLEKEAARQQRSQTTLVNAAIQRYLKEQKESECQTT